MQVFNTVKHFTITASVLLFSFTAASAFSQTATAPTVTMPTVTTPTMPTVTAPTISDDFYTPGADAKTTTTTTTTSATANDSTTTTTGSTKTETNTNTITTKKDTTQTTLNDLLSNLTASDISSLGNLGLLSSLTGTNSNSYTSSSDSSTTALLNEILTELQELKTKVNSNALKVSDSTTNSTSTQTTPQTSTSSNSNQVQTQKPHSTLLRFIVNGYDIRKTCRIVYISKIEKDGSFLLTGDRRYTSDNAVRSETFYLLFKSKGVENGQKIYSVAAAVTQDKPNEYSFIYQLAQRTDLIATQTGNLVILRTTDSTWQLDLLLDLEEQ